MGYKVIMKRFAFLIGAVLFVVLAWTAGWLAIAFSARNQIVALAEADGETVPRLACRQLDVSGYPFNFNFSCEGLEAGYQDLSLSLPGLHVAVPVMWPARALLSARGDITLADAFTGSRATLAYDTMTASVRLEGLRVGRVSVVADRLVWRNANFGEVLEAGASHVEAHAVDLPARHVPERGAAALALYARADGIEVPGLAVAQGTGTLEGELSGLPDDLRRIDAHDPVRAWQAAGGALTIGRLALADGARSLETKSNLALDGTGRLEGRIETTSRGLVETLGATMPEQLRLIVFGSPNQDGSYSQTLNARAGIVLAGFLPVLVVPPLF
jgi:hypothetical protein